MNRYEILNFEGDVINTIIADQAFVDEHYPNQYRLVETDPEPTQVPILTPLQLRRLFTFEEKVALEQAVKDGNLTVKVLLDDLSAAEFIDLTDPLVIQGLSLLVSQELLTQERADQIITNEMPEVAL